MSDIQAEMIHNKITLMLAYQKKHNITKFCIANATYLKDFINSIGIACKVVPVINVMTDHTKKINIITVHMVVELDNGNMFDPSYEIYQHKDSDYFNNIADYNSWLKKAPNVISTGLSHKETVSGFIEFIATAERINTKICYSSKRIAYVKALHKFTKL